MLTEILHLRKYTNTLKYCTLLLIFFNCTATLYAQSSKALLQNTCNKVFTNLSSIPLVSYKVTLTTLEANNITSTYSADVFENWDSESFFSVYKFNNKQLFVSYQNNLGLERFWFGKQNNLPELKAKEIDNKILTTAISYSTFMINPLWLNIPIDSKDDQGFLVISTYNKNKYSNYTKVEYYINKDYIPIRILYYNNISNFPIIEILVTDYKYINKNYFISKLEYKDNSSKKITIIEKSDINFNPEQPTWLESLKHIIKDNINEYYTSFVLGIRNEQDVKDSLSKVNIPSNTQDSLNTNLDKNPIIENYLDNKEKNNTAQEDKSNNDALDLLPSNKTTSGINNNEDFLKALDELSDNKNNNTAIIAPPVVNKANKPPIDKSKGVKPSKIDKDLNVTVKKDSLKKVTPKIKNDLNIKEKNKSNESKTTTNYKDQTSNPIELKENKLIDEKPMVQNKTDSYVENPIIKPDNEKEPIIEKKPPVKKESDNADSNKGNLLNNLF